MHTAGSDAMGHVWREGRNMTVTDLAECGKSKYKVYIDDEFAFVLYKGELHKYGIKQDGELSQETFDVLFREVLPGRAKLRAMHLLTKRPYTEARLRQKLKDGLYVQAHIDEAIAYVKSFGYIDDEAYARDYITYHAQDMSRRQMEKKLCEKGIGRDCVCRLLGELAEEVGDACEQEQIRRLFQKKYKGILPTDSMEYAKMACFFARKGYQSETVNRALGIRN